MIFTSYSIAFSKVGGKFDRESSICKGSEQKVSIMREVVKVLDTYLMLDDICMTLV